jgi:hypothetical protein
MADQGFGTKKQMLLCLFVMAVADPTVQEIVVDKGCAVWDEVEPLVAVDRCGDHELAWAVMRVFNATREVVADHPIVQKLVDCWYGIVLEKGEAVRIAFLRRFAGDRDPESSVHIFPSPSWGMNALAYGRCFIADFDDFSWADT